jgi:ATP/ADP translocase
MSNFFQRVFRIREGEGAMVLLMGFLLLSNDMARQMSGIVGISDFINTGGVNGILIVWSIDSVVVIITAALASLIVDRFNRFELFRWTAFGFALAFIIMRLLPLVIPIPEQINAGLLFLMSQQQWLIFPLFFWVLANDTFEMAQAVRIFPVIGAWSFVGKVIGNTLALLPPILNRAGLMAQNELTINAVLTVNIVVYLLLFVVISLGLRRIELRETVQRGQTIKDTLTEGWGFLKEVPAFRFLAMIIITVAIATVVIEFRFLDVAKRVYTDGAAYKEFYSWVRIAMAVLSFLIQGFATSRIINRLNLKNTFVILPVVMLASVIALIANGGLIVATASQMVSKINRNTVDDSARKAFLSLVPEERRGRVQLFLDNYLQGFGTLLGCLVTGAIVWPAVSLLGLPLHIMYLIIAALFGAIGIWAVIGMRNSYDASLFNWRLKRRTRRSEAIKKLDSLNFD